jgi:feruloyl-CoA synthase
VATGPDTIAKVLFTSGSTGEPKGIVNTHRMLTANQESLRACWPFLDDEPPVVVDWLPWSHTFGGNHNFHLILRNGGTLYVDRGRPAPGLIDITLRNLAEVGPTLWFNVPRGFDQAVLELERDSELARGVFRNLRVLFYAAAALGATTRARLEEVARAAGNPDVFFTSAWGSTETSPLATSAHFPTRTTGVLGVPVPGVLLKLARVDDRHELRVKGPNVTPGAWQRGGAIANVALDADGFLPTGDAGRLVDEANPEAGVVFAGRISENFKLSSGTWVNVGSVRLALVDRCAPLLADAVVAGHDREALGALLVLSPAGTKDVPVDQIRSRLRGAIEAYNANHPGSSERIRRALVLTRPLSLDDGETTDKGYTNQRRVLEKRADDVERLFAAQPDAEVLLFEEP